MLWPRAASSWRTKIRAVLLEEVMWAGLKKECGWWVRMGEIFQVEEVGESLELGGSGGSDA